MNYFQPYMEVLKQTRRDLIYGIIYIKYNNMWIYKCNGLYLLFQTRGRVKFEALFV